jgi:hypothetical protein
MVTLPPLICNELQAGTAKLGDGLGVVVTLEGLETAAVAGCVGFTVEGDTVIEELAAG